MRRSQGQHRGPDRGFAREAARVAIASFALLALTGCGVFRPMVVAVSNTDQTGREAPSLKSTHWLLPDGTKGWPSSCDWQLLVFFKPL